MKYNITLGYDTVSTFIYRDNILYENIILVLTISYLNTHPFVMRLNVMYTYDKINRSVEEMYSECENVNIYYFFSSYRKDMMCKICA